MGYPDQTSGLVFEVLREANLARLPLFKNKQGKLAHSKPDGSDWSLREWSDAVTGEHGELANLLKKLHRGDTGEVQQFTITNETDRKEVAKEIADVAIYLDILAYRCGVDLGSAIISKFNEVSKRVEVPVFLSSSGRFVNEESLDA